MGVLPTAVTSAQPNWIPFTVRAGSAVDINPAEDRHFVALRQLTVDGTSHAPAWSADGRRLVFTSRSDGHCGEVRQIDLEHGTSQTVPTGPGSASRGIFDADGDVMVAHAPGHIPPCEKQPAALRQPVGSAALPTPLPGLLQTLSDTDIAVFDDGKLQPLISRTGYDGDMSISAARLLFTGVSNGDLELFVAHLDGTNPRPVTTSVGYDGYGRYSPDGSSLVWQAEPEPSDDKQRAEFAGPAHTIESLVVMVAGSLGQRRRVAFAGGRFNITPSFMPDSRRILLASDLDAAANEEASPSFELYLVDPADKRPERVTYSPGFDVEPTVSPDGKYLAFSSNRGSDEPGASNVFVASLRE